jgi:two-component system response regulator FlrC
LQAVQRGGLEPLAPQAHPLPAAAVSGSQPWGLSDTTAPAAGHEAAPSHTMPAAVDAATAWPTRAEVAEQPAAAGLQWAVRHSELRVILDAIRNTSSREAAARLLGISPRTLRYKLAQMRDLGMMAAEAAN